MVEDELGHQSPCTVTTAAEAVDEYHDVTTRDLLVSVHDQRFSEIVTVTGAEFSRRDYVHITLSFDGVKRGGGTRGGDE